MQLRVRTHNPKPVPPHPVLLDWSASWLPHDTLDDTACWDCPSGGPHQGSFGDSRSLAFWQPGFLAAPRHGLLPRHPTTRLRFEPRTLRVDARLSNHSVRGDVTSRGYARFGKALRGSAGFREAPWRSTSCREAPPSLAGPHGDP